jgi:hypothetical protein
VDLDAVDDFGHAAGEIRLQATATKTRTERRIDLVVSPGLREILRVLKLQADGATYIFGGDAALAPQVAHNARARLMKWYGAPDFSWQRLRQTCASFLTNAPGIFRSARIYRSAEQMGHSPEVARKYYLGLVRGIPPDARTLDAVLGIDRAVTSVAVKPGVALGGDVTLPARAKRPITLERTA